MRENGHASVFVTASITPSLEGRLTEGKASVFRLTAQPYGVEDAHETATQAKRLGAEWVIVDGYNFGGMYQEALKREGLRILFVDDYGHADHYAADTVLNQNVSAKADLYARRDDATELLLDTRYVLLQRQFRNPPRGERPVPDIASRLLVTMGGSDGMNGTEKVIRALQGLEGIDPTVVIGGANPHQEAVESLCRDVGFSCIINATNMRELMEQADMAISASGTTSYELAYIGVPALTLILANNQVALAEGMAAAGCSINLGWHPQLTQKTIRSAVQELARNRNHREKMATAGRSLVDGDGASRVLMHLTGNSLRLRKARHGDARLLWEWANDAETRSASLSSASIPWEQHQEWIAMRLQDPQTMLLLAFDREDEPMGYIRFETKEETVLSIAVAPGQRGKGHGSDILRSGLQSFFREHPSETMHAYVKEGNDASATLFRKAGFTELPKEEKDGHPVRHFTLQPGTLTT